jgi:3'-phosphoadenosine 5'-phosphosulfate sulfotransferase (PAPS reductase)/FAD synthetase
MRSKTEVAIRLRTQEEALKYICKEKWGYISDLKKVIGVEMFERFRSVGCIECGISLALEGDKPSGTWKKTETADRERSLYDSPSWYEKKRNAILGF